VIILGRMLPGGIDGLGIVEALRRTDNKTPILILSALAEVDDRIRGLRAGGDDCLTKPFALGELSARLEALVRRSQGMGVQTTLTVADSSPSVAQRDARGQAHSAAAARIQAARIPDASYRPGGDPRDALENVWEHHFDPQTNVIDVHVSRLRQKIDEGFDRPLIDTVRSVGYRLSANA
jgi:two-component system, OmpR family, response regulator